MEVDRGILKRLEDTLSPLEWKNATNAGIRYDERTGAGIGLQIVDSQQR